MIWHACTVRDWETTWVGWWGDWWIGHLNESWCICRSVPSETETKSESAARIGPNPFAYKILRSVTTLAVSQNGPENQVAIQPYWNILKCSYWEQSFATEPNWHFGHGYYLIWLPVGMGQVLYGHLICCKHPLPTYKAGCTDYELHSFHSVVVLTGRLILDICTLTNCCHLQAKVKKLKWRGLTKSWRTLGQNSKVQNYFFL